VQTRGGPPGKNVERSPVPININIKVANEDSSGLKNLTAVGTNTECVTPVTTQSREQLHQTVVQPSTSEHTSEHARKPKLDNKNVTVKLTDHGGLPNTVSTQHPYPRDASDSGGNNQEPNAIANMPITQSSAFTVRNTLSTQHPDPRDASNSRRNSQEPNSTENMPITQGSTFPERNNPSYRRSENNTRHSRGSYNQQQQLHTREGSGEVVRPASHRRSTYGQKSVCLYTTLHLKASISANSVINLKLPRCP
jgi:hypothetical protein